jgi:hypothetical protein
MLVRKGVVWMWRLFTLLFRIGVFRYKRILVVSSLDDNDAIAALRVTFFMDKRTDLFNEFRHIVVLLVLVLPWEYIDLR